MQSISQEHYCGPEYASKEPYPEVVVREPNEHYARLLMEDYSGKDSEFTAATQYIYHHFVSAREKEAATALEKIAIVEMMHMEKLADAIIQLGGDPTYKQGCDKSWTAENVAYGETLLQRLHMNLASEYGAIHNYRSHIRQISDPCIRALLARIIKDEEIHICRLQELIEKYSCR